jgi:drug/metabolite transporter (DMT)-like permease
VKRRDIAGLVLLGALWGAVYPLTTVVLRELPTSAVVATRTGLAALVLAPLAWRSGVLGVVAARPVAVVVAAGLQATVPLVLLTAGQRHVGAAVAGIVLASQPVWTVVFTGVLDRAVQPVAAAGVLVGLAGVGLLVLGDRGGAAGTTVFGGVVLVGAAACFAAGAVFIERVVPDVPPLGLATAAMAVTTVALVPFALGAGAEWPTGGTLAWLVVLGAVATGAALVLFYELIVDVGAVLANLAGYLAPGFAVLFGVVLLDEAIGVLDLGGLALILAGTYLASTAAQTPARTVDRPSTSRYYPRRGS